MCNSSKNQLQRELDFAPRTSSSQNLTKCPVLHAVIWITEVGVVEEVEKLRSELEIDIFKKRKAL